MTGKVSTYRQGAGRRWIWLFTLLVTCLSFSGSIPHVSSYQSECAKTELVVRNELRQATRRPVPLQVYSYTVLPFDFKAHFRSSAGVYGSRASLSLRRHLKVFSAIKNRVLPGLRWPAPVMVSYLHS